MPIIHRFDLTLTVSLLLAAGTGFAAEPRSATYLWWEAEEPTAMAHGTIGRFAPETPEGRVLSGSARLEPGDQNGPPLTATYGLHVPSDGTYDLWVRKFWRHGPFKWRFGDSEWQTCGREIALHDTAFIRMHEGADWVHLARLPLEDGPVRFEIESLDNLGWFDAFLLIDGPFLPAGRLKPGEKSGLAAPGFFAWEPDPDSFRESPIDLRHLNETSAGVNGPLRRDGKRFLLGDGTPVRFWMTQASGFSEMTPALADFHARRLAKAGVNMVRLYFLDAFRQWRAGESEAFALQLDRIHYAVATLKQQGIYTKFGHLHWDTHVHALDDDDLSGLKEGEPATAALFFNEPLQRRYLEWIAAVMTPVNPYTGLSLAEDPAVGIVEVQNESNTLFWTMHPERLPAGTSDLIRQAFARFAAEKYGSLAAALAHWGDPLDGDDPPAGRLGFLPIYELTARGGAAHANRAADQRECFARAQYALYAKMKAAFRQLGIVGLISGSNWKTADPSVLGPLEYYSYLATDVVAKNEYFSPRHLRNERFYAVDEGDRFISLSAMRAPEMAGVLMTAQPVNRPYMIIENNWDNPSAYRAEFPFLVATYGSMSGVDGWSFFAYDIPVWSTEMGVWNISSPSIIGQFPATALIYRRGDVVTGPPAVFESVRLPDLYAGRPIALPEIQYKDAVWQRTLGGDPQVEFLSAIDPKAFFAGPVRLELGATRSALHTADLDRLIDTANRRIHNTNQQLVWDYGQGHITVNTPASPTPQ